MSGWTVTRGSERSLVYTCVCVFFGLRQNKEFSVGGRRLEATLRDAFILLTESGNFCDVINKVKFTLEQAMKACGGEGVDV